MARFNNSRGNENLLQIGEYFCRYDFVNILFINLYIYDFNHIYVIQTNI